MKNDDLLFYDCEVFKHDTLVVFKTIDKKLVKAYWNKFEGIGKLIEGKILVGFNNFWYDDKILTRMIDGYSPEQIKKLNDEIIKYGRDGHPVSPKIRSIDCFQQIDVSKPGLKKIEGNMGKSIVESAIPFDIDRPLTAAERQEVFDYCCYDVDSTIDIYKVREKGYFYAKERLLTMLENPDLVDKARRWNTTTISANVLIPKFRGSSQWAKIRVPDWILGLVPPDVRDMWEQANSHDFDPKKLKVKSVTHVDFDNEFQFAFGGLHGAHKSVKRVENVLLLDVASMYPNIILNIEALGAGHGKYKEILDERLRIKHIDKILSDALKLILNSAYGNLNNQYSILNNPRAAYSVCFYGQAALYELCRRLHGVGCKIINANTDGVAFTADNEDYREVWTGWERDFGLNLELDRFELFVQRDVNNYVAKKGDYLKCKGGDVNRYKEDALFKNNNARILDIALVEKVVHGKDVLQTLIDNMDKPELYQYILQAGSTFQGTFDRDGRQYQKVNRVFAVKRGGVCLQKRRIDGGHVHFPDAPENMLVWNGECRDLKDFHKIVDLNHYYQIVNKRLEKWL